MKNIFLFYGANITDSKADLNKWEQGFIQKYGDINLEVFTEAPEIGTLIQIAQTTPFLSEKRMLIVHDLLSSTKKEELEKFCDHLKTIPETTVLIMYETATLDKRLKSTKTLLKTVTAKEFPALDKNNLPQWIQGQLGKYDKSINYHLAVELGHQFSQNPERLNTELTKLSTYNLSQEITKEAIQTVCSLPHNDSVFDLTDALSSNDPTKKITVLHHLYERGEDLIRLLYLLINQIRMLTITNIVNGNFSKVSDLKIHPYVQKKLKQQSGRLPLNKLYSLYQQLHKIDQDIKTGGIRYTKTNQTEMLFALERLLVK